MKKRNATDLTSRNNNARKKEIDALRARLDATEAHLIMVSGCMETLGPFISAIRSKIFRLEEIVMKKKGTKKPVKSGKKGSC